VREACHPIDEIHGSDFGDMASRIGDARVVLLGEATHGTAEFYAARDALTRLLITEHGFNLVAVEADWPDAARVNAFVKHRPVPPGDATPAFSRFPTWMWRNREFHTFATWLREHNADRTAGAQAGFYGLDLYSMYTSIDAVLTYLDGVDPDAAAMARRRYGCLTPWEADPVRYGEAAISGRYRSCEDDAVAALRDLLGRRLELARGDSEQLFDAIQNARLVANAERYYRVMYYGSSSSWNLRDQHMYDTLQALLAFHGPDARAIVWEHNSHVGDAAATEMAARGELNVGRLCRRDFGDAAYAVGLATDHGTVAAASTWGGAMEIKNVRPAHVDSYERVFHDSGVPAFTLPLREPRRAEVRAELSGPRLERAIGVIYRPESEMLSHYFQASLAAQFDELVWFDATTAVDALPVRTAEGAADTYPFGL
jgi:protein-L-isoaspartate(D-aspartate) O-methyltransferase